MRDDDEDASPASAKDSRRSRTLRQQLTASPMSWGRSGKRSDGGSEYDSPASPPGPPEGDDDSAVSCSTPVALACKGGGGRVVDPADPDVLYFGDELRLWAVSEYAVARQARDGSSNNADLGGYVGVYFKGRKRRARTGAGRGRDAPDFKGSELGRFPLARTGQQPLACVPPVGDDAPGDFVEAAFRVVDPRGLKAESHAVKIGDEVLLVDRDNHAWNTSTSGVVGYLAPRLRGERGETRVKFSRDISQFLRGSAALDESAKPPPQRPPVRYGDSLWLVTCPPSAGDASHPGGGRRRRKEHVLTNFKKDTSALLGGYLTIDPRGFPLQFSLERPPPALESVVVGSDHHYRVGWGQTVPFSRASTVSLSLSSGASAACDLHELEGDRKWLPLRAPPRALKHRASSPSLANARGPPTGAVLLEVRDRRVEAADDDGDAPPPGAARRRAPPPPAMEPYEPLAAVRRALRPRREAATAAERGAVEELRRVVAGDASHGRWLEDGELLRFVRARKTPSSGDLFREAADWRRQRRNKDGAYAESAQGSFGGDEQAWVDGAAAPPDWFMTENLPFELFGADANGIPVTYIGLGRMDLSGICREVGIERLEQKMIMQNDMFIDMAREKTLALTRRAGEPTVTHGGVFVIDCDGLGRRRLAEVRIFRHVSAALKVLHRAAAEDVHRPRARIFSMVWKLIKPMLDARIISKINIIGVHDSLQPVIDELGPANLPSIFGGGTYDLKIQLSDKLRPRRRLRRVQGEARAVSGVAPRARCPRRRAARALRWRRVEIDNELTPAGRLIMNLKEI
ncbi:phosphatidylinositol transfer protein [Aureococcus anophagefferens]|uniref:Phosphatidylinositol transfer protein n=1 Tax=Aureococcus anophagefferens TaxID=44056 RepID=A0ABR1G7Q0_AURAN